MKSHLQVKVCTLMFEMTCIRHKEEKWKNRARLATINDKEGLLDYSRRAFWSMREHRLEIKPEARSTHLTYGAMRGVPYAKMEHICYGVLKGHGSSEPNWAKIKDMFGRFVKGENDIQGYQQRFAEWLTEAKQWYEGNPDRIKQLQSEREARVAALKANKKPYVKEIA